MFKITSPQNPKIKNILKLNKAKERKLQNIFIIEGARELSLAIEGGYTIDSVFVCEELFQHTDYPGVLRHIPEEIQYQVTPLVFEKIAYRENSDGLIALAIPKNHSLENISLSANPFIIVLESVEKPGNLGAILRTADAAGVDAVIVCDPLCDLYNPNVIRSSVGCIFTVQTAIGNSIETLEWLRKKGINSYAAELTNSNWYYKTDFMGPSAVVMGTEADGLTDFWINNSDGRIKIPMQGAIDSLNVSVSTAILTFEAMRQRNFN